MDNRELQKRLTILYQKHHSWLLSVAFNCARNEEIAQDLVQELYLYLGEKQNQKLYYKDSFNLLYCYNFIKSRWINLIKRENKSVHRVKDNRFEESYDINEDIRWEDALQQIKEHLKEIEKTNKFAAAKIFQLYHNGDFTMEELANEIGVSKSTIFLNVKQIKEHLKQNIKNPFHEEQSN